MLAGVGADIVGGALVACFGGSKGLRTAAGMLLVCLVHDFTDGGGFSRYSRVGAAH